MTILAGNAQLPSMNVAVTLDTCLLNIREDEVLVAADTGGGFVRTNQRKTRLTMVEVERTPERCPRFGSMTRLAVPFQ